MLSVEKHPNADRLKLPTVTWGAGHAQAARHRRTEHQRRRQGAKGRAGPGRLGAFDGHAEEESLKELKPTKIPRHPDRCHGLLAACELGISDEHEGIILLEDDAPVGMPLADFMGDIVLEVDVLPNMARCLSMIGVAREVAALTGQTLQLPPIDVMPRPTASRSTARSRSQIEDPKLSRRYAAVLIKGVKIGPAPGWMQRRLTYAGMRPINNIVDITNYVMLEWGQPLHAFDYDVLVSAPAASADDHRAARAGAGEMLTTLDDQERKLIAGKSGHRRHAGPIALAGVMGGAGDRGHAPRRRTSCSNRPTSISSAFAGRCSSSESAERGQRPLQPGHPSGDGQARGRARRRTDAAATPAAASARGWSTATPRRCRRRSIDAEDGGGASPARHGLSRPTEAMRILDALEFEVEARRRRRRCW